MKILQVTKTVLIFKLYWSVPLAASVLFGQCGHAQRGYAWTFCSFCGYCKINPSVTSIEAKKLICNYPKLWVFWKTNFMHGGVLILTLSFEPFASVQIRNNLTSDFYCKTWRCLTNWQNLGEKSQVYQYFCLALDQGILFRSYIKN